MFLSYVEEGKGGDVDEVRVSKKSMENYGKLVNQSRVGPLKVEENALRKTTSLIE